MRRFVRSFAISLFLVSLGTVLGPVLIAAAGAAFAPTTAGYGVNGEVTRLIDAYRNRLEPGHLFTSIMPPPDGAECGYDPDVVFPDGFAAMMRAERRHAYTDYAGYSALDQWRGQNRDQAWIRSITIEIGNRMTPFEIGFLRRCIQSTLFSGLCMKQVERFGEMVPRFPRTHDTGLFAEGHEDRVVCSFVDGVAARNGIRLSPRAAGTDEGVSSRRAAR